MKADEWFAAGFCVFLGAVMGITVMGIFGVSPLKSDAIKAGVAEYRIVDPATGKSEFRFIPCECEEGK